MPLCMYTASHKYMHDCSLLVLSCIFIFFPDIFFFTPSTFLPSTRLGVSLGTEAICRGGGRAAAKEQQADNRQQLSGGTLCGSVLLSTLGESRKEEMENFHVFLKMFPGL